MLFLLSSSLFIYADLNFIIIVLNYALVEKSVCFACCFSLRWNDPGHFFSHFAFRNTGQRDGAIYFTLKLMIYLVVKPPLSYSTLVLIDKVNQINCLWKTYAQSWTTLYLTLQNIGNNFIVMHYSRLTICVYKQATRRHTLGCTNCRL